MRLMDQLIAEAARFGITVNEEAKAIILDAPEGYQFGPELHALVNAKEDSAEPWSKIIRSAIDDVRENGPLLEPCPPDCPCKEKD